MQFVKTHKEVVKAVAKAIKQIDRINTTEISVLDQFYIDTARQNMFKVITSNGYELAKGTYRVQSRKSKK